MAFGSHFLPGISISCCPSRSPQSQSPRTRSTARRGIWSWNSDPIVLQDIKVQPAAAPNGHQNKNRVLPGSAELAPGSGRRFSAPAAGTCPGSGRSCCFHGESLCWHLLFCLFQAAQGEIQGWNSEITGPAVVGNRKAEVQRLK